MNNVNVCMIFESYHKHQINLNLDKFQNGQNSKLKITWFVDVDRIDITDRKTDKSKDVATYRDD